MKFLIWNTRTQTVEAVVKDFKAARKWREKNGKQDYFNLEVIRQDYFWQDVKFYN